MHVTVVSPEQAVFDGAADAVVAPAYDGQVGILPRHAPFLTLLGTGVLQVRQGSASRRLRVAGGFLQVRGGGDAVRNVADRVHASSQIRAWGLAGCVLEPVWRPSLFPGRRCMRQLI